MSKPLRTNTNPEWLKKMTKAEDEYPSISVGGLLLRLGLFKDSKIDVAMKSISEEHRYKWCEGGPCACMGCANVSGGLVDKGFSKKDWERWVVKNPQERSQHDL